ncbi:MAG: ATP-dependent DNA ligase [Candidatus Thorarchaeota archaeon]
MLYETLTQAYNDIEKTAGTLDKIELFSELLSKANPDEVGLIIALTMGKLHPDWKSQPEIGIAEKTAVQVVASAASVSERDVQKILLKTGDIGSTAEELLQESAQSTLFSEDVTISFVYETLDQTSKISGSGSNKMKIATLVGLLTDANPIEARYILRTVTGSLRLGLGDMGIIDALATAFTGSRDARGEIENAFNVCSDLSHVASVLAKDGIDAVKAIKTEVGVPIRMMAAKKLSTPEEIIEKAGGKALVENKYDGERVQVHKNGDEVILFSRRQEIITSQYPDVVELVREHIQAQTSVLEGECVAIDPETGRMKPFQELMRRRRKTDIETTQEEVPVSIFFFDILYNDGEDVTSLPMLKRRELMEKIIKTSDRVNLTTAELTDDPERLQEIFEDAIGTGHEGVIAKAVHKDATYQAGSRSWLWIKLKASYTEGLADSLDLVLVGAFHGRGKRAGLYGAFLASVYDPNNGTFPTVCKIGTGFSDDMLVEFKERLDEYKIKVRHSKVISEMEADVWFEPLKVIEVLGDEITKSQAHPAARNYLKDSGLAIRFPRFTGNWRDDKSPEQATSVDDLIEAFELQRGENQ